MDHSPILPRGRRIWDTLFFMPSDNSSHWKVVWEKHRTRICRAGGLVLILIAQPRSNVLFVLGLLVALAGEAIRVWAAGHIRKGRELAQQGPYAMTRNPLYLGSFVMTCGFAFICTSPMHHWLSTALIWGSVLATFYWLYPPKIDFEETDLRNVFGAEFDAYRRRVPRFWPDWTKWREAVETTSWNWAQAKTNKEHKTLWALFGLALLLRIKMVYRL